MGERYDPNEPQTLAFDPEHPDLGWHYSEPLPLYTNRLGRLLDWLRGRRQR